MADRPLLLDERNRDFRFPSGEIQSISQHSTIWRWLHNNNNTFRSNNRMNRVDTTLITDPELLHLHASPFLTQLQLKSRIEQGIPATKLPHIPLHSTGAIPLSLDGFWDILNTHRWNSSLLWLERDFDDLIQPDSSLENPTPWHHKVQPDLPFSTVSRRVQIC
jgi:hypothetical protein